MSFVSLLFGLMLVFLAGCGPRPGDLTDPCSFLTVGEIEKTLDVDHVQMRRLPRATIRGFDHRGGQVCLLSASGLMNGMMFQIEVGTPGDFAREKAQVMGRGLKKAEDVPGIAETAFWNAGTTTAAALKNGHAVIVSGIYRKADALNLIKKAVARLP